MVCMSYNGTIRHVKSLASGFDSNVLQWSAKLVEIVYQLICSTNNLWLPQLYISTLYNSAYVQNVHV